MHRSFCAALAVAAAGLWSSTSPTFTVASAPRARPAILIRHDRPDSAYRTLGSRYVDILAHIDERVEGVVLRPRWVLTAAHAVQTIGPFDQPFALIRGERYGVQKIITHPDWEGNWDDLLSNHDLALLKLDRPVPSPRGITLYRDRDEHGMVVTILGRGKAGTGATGQVGDKDGAVRGATNRIDGVSRTALLWVFDVGRDATELEGVAGSGDSGGPAIVDRNDTLYLVGIGSAGTMRPGYAAYGALDIYTRVSAFADWVEETIAADPPATVDWTPPIRLGPDPDWPATPVGRLARDFFAAYGRDLTALEVFYREHGNPDVAAGGWSERIQQGLVERLGPVRLHSLATAGPYMIQVMVYAPKRDAWQAIGLDASPEPPHRLARLYLKTEAPPP